MKLLRNIKRRIDVWFFLYEDDGEVVPVSDQLLYYGMITFSIAVVLYMLVVVL